VVLFLAYPNLLGTKRLGCCCNTQQSFEKSRKLQILQICYVRDKSKCAYYCHQ
jgi:hypothetical protein